MNESDEQRIWKQITEIYLSEFDRREILHIPTFYADATTGEQQIYSPR